MLSFCIQKGNSIDDYRAANGLFHLRKNLVRPVDMRANTYQELLLTNLQCSFLVVALPLLQSTNPSIDIVFLLYILHFGDVETNPGPESDCMSNAHSIVGDKTITIYNINFRSVRNKLDFLHNFADEFDIVTEQKQI